MRRNGDLFLKIRGVEGEGWSLVRMKKKKGWDCSTEMKEKVMTFRKK